MSPGTQIALATLILFFAVAGLSLVWPRLAGLRWSDMRLAGGGGRATMDVPGSTPAMDEAEHQDGPQSLYRQVSRWFWAMSPMQRIGTALALGAVLLLALWLVLSRDRAQRVFGSPVVLTILVVYTLALTQYLAVSVRPLLWRLGYGADPEVRRTAVYATSIVGWLLTCLFWVGVQIRYTAPPALVDASARTVVEPQNGIANPVLAYDGARQDYVAARSELETLAASVSTAASKMSTDPLSVDLRTWPSRDQLGDAQRRVRAAQSRLRGAWASVPPDMRSGLEPPPAE